MGRMLAMHHPVVEQPGAVETPPLEVRKLRQTAVRGLTHGLMAPKQGCRDWSACRLALESTALFARNWSLLVSGIYRQPDIQQDNKVLVHEGDAGASASPWLATCVEAREGLEVRATREGEGRVAVKSSIISGGGKSEILG